MNRSTQLVVVSLLIGAAAMYGASNFHIHIVPNGSSDVPAVAREEVPARNRAGSEPGRLPESLIQSKNPSISHGEAIQPVSFQDAAPQPSTTSNLPPLEIKQVVDGDFTWVIKSPIAGNSSIAGNSPIAGSASTVALIGSKGTIVLNRPMVDAEKNNVTISIEGAVQKDSDLTAAGLATAADSFAFTDLRKLPGISAKPFKLSIKTGTPKPLEVTLQLPLAGANSAPALLGYANIANQPLVPIPTPAPPKILVYTPSENGTYLRLKVYAVGSPKLHFILQLPQEAAKEVTVTSSTNEPASATWDYTLNLGLISPNIATAFLTVRADYTSNDIQPLIEHAFAPQDLTLQISTTLATLAAPKVADPEVDTTKYKIAPALDISTPEIRAYRTNSTTLSKVTVTPPTGSQSIALTVDDGKPILQAVASPPVDVVFASVTFGTGRDHILKVVGLAGPVTGQPTQILVKVRTQGPSVESVSYPGFGTGNGTEKITIKFTTGSLLDKTTAEKASNYKIAGTNGTTTNPTISNILYDSIADTATLTVTSVTPGTYQLSLPATGNSLIDLYGNSVQKSPDAPSDSLFQTILVTQAPDQLTSPTAGVTLTPGPPVAFPEYAPRSVFPSGFNPADHVETRVVRLYYYRDAHRVAMIVNRSVKSYSIASVEVRQRAADRARDDADNSTIERKRLENIAVQKAQAARAAETELKNAQAQGSTGQMEAATATQQLNQQQQLLDQANNNLKLSQQNIDLRKQQDPAVMAAQSVLTTARNNQTNAPSTVTQQALDKAQSDFNTTYATVSNRIDNENFTALNALKQQVDTTSQTITTLRQVISTGTTTAGAAPADVARLQQKVQAARDEEVQATSAWQVKELQEGNLKANQFRREVAAATADPNTYAPGDIKSEDPVQQVSISVIGEGLIQLRGPIKGINIIRIMINQIDAPAGQVRIAVHTIQVNGERGNRMEKVAMNIQRYIDHSRFLTAQSAQMLKKAVTTVASRKAEDAAIQAGPNCTQEWRDFKYLHAFFGKDFIDELMLLDSEFLKTGNKILSIHSMDSTSLSTALMLMALAKNEVRREILAEFAAQLQTQLPQAEIDYYLAGLTGAKCEACCDKKHYVLAYNAKFQSLLGFFNVDVAGNDTITPLQREFIRLAQIFKAQMVTEIGLKQRYLERSLVEERFGGDYIGELKKAKQAEDDAKAELQKIQTQVFDATAQSQQAILTILTLLDGWEGIYILSPDLIFSIGNDQNLGNWYTSKNEFIKAVNNIRTSNNDAEAQIKLKRREVRFDFDDIDNEKNKNIIDLLTNCVNVIDDIIFISPKKKEVAQRAKKLLQNAIEMKGLSIIETAELINLLSQIQLIIKEETNSIRAQLKSILDSLGADPADTSKAIATYSFFREDIRSKIKPGKDVDIRSRPALALADKSMQALAGGSAKYQAALRKAKLVRRPLDEKKLLDLLVDDMEDKYIEQLEGVRAHTANVDNYLKSISTALDDDFNTQFYNPAFRKVREASRLWDVTLGQIETTTILANNRSFAKVSPSATFEFDLPKRDIMITEGLKSAKGLIDQYGALMKDPTFLSLGKLYSGVPSTAQFNSGASQSAVRNVLPGLPSSADEMFMAQAGAGRQDIGAPLDSLIPDPAIYKFETGTGFEIRPVLAPDGQAVVFNFQYLYTTDVREPVRADEKHLGRVKRHFINTDVQLSNFELREVSKYVVALKAARTAKGVPLLQDIPGVGLLFRPLPSAESSLQENLIYSQATIFPTLFDLMGLRYAPAIADLDPLSVRLAEFAARNRDLDLLQRTADVGATRVDQAMQIPFGERRSDLYHPQVSIPYQHPNGYIGTGLRQRDSNLVEGDGQQYDPRQAFPATQYSPSQTWESATRPLPPGTYTPRPSGYPSSGVPGGYQQPGGYPAPGVSPNYYPNMPSSVPSTPGSLEMPRQIAPGASYSPGTTTITPSQPPRMNSGQPQGVPPGYPTQQYTTPAPYNPYNQTNPPLPVLPGLPPPPLGSTLPAPGAR